MTGGKDSRCRLFIGTSGYSYPEWVTSGFYPEKTRPADMLVYYAGRFSATELNYTWYQMPKAPAIEKMIQRIPDGFRFAAKLTRTLTHEVDPGEWRQQAALYREGIAPLLAHERLLAVLVQLPPFFKRTEKNRHFLSHLLDALSGLPLAVEFRHSSWAADRVFAELERRRITLVAVDEPDLTGLFPALDVVTNPDLFYVRFHGRNSRGWGKGSMQHQFNYDYTAAELGEWTAGAIPAMAGRAVQGCLFFNNHVAGRAPENALELISLMREAQQIKRGEKDGRFHHSSEYR